MLDPFEDLDIDLADFEDLPPKAFAVVVLILLLWWAVAVYENGQAARNLKAARAVAASFDAGARLPDVGTVDDLGPGRLYR